MIRHSEETDGFLAGLIERYSAQSPHFYVLTAKGDYFKFRHFEDHAELTKLRKDARKFVKDMTGGGAHPAWLEYIESCDADTLLYVYHMAALGLEFGRVTPAEKEGAEPVYEKMGEIDHLMLLRIAKHAPNLFDMLKDALDSKNAVAAVTFEDKAIEDAEKKSSGTQSGDTSSQSAATSGASTPTS